MKICDNDLFINFRRVPEISADIKQIKNKITRIETDSENLDNVMGRYNELSEKCMKSADIMKNLQSDVNELSIAVEKRSRHYKLTESYFVTYMKYSFKKILEFRQFKVSYYDEKFGPLKVYSVLS